MTATSLARPDYNAHLLATRASFAQVAQVLSSILGAKLCAYLGLVKETRAVHQWAAGVREPSAETQRRLRLALQAAAAIASADSPAVAQAWFQGLNPQLDDRSPVRMLREGNLDEVGPEVLGAARAFLAGG